jgi:uncharacterized protein
MKTESLGIKFVSFLCLTLCLLILVSPATGGEKKLIRIATASMGGGWYPAGGAIGSIISKYVPNAEGSAHPSAASVENIRLLEEKRSNLALVMPDVAYYAVTATDRYQGKNPAKIRGLFSFFPNELLIIARADSDIKKIEDLKNHKVAFGPPGSGAEVMTKKIIGEYGINYEDLDARFIKAPEMAEALKDKVIDAAMYTIGTPAAAFVDLCTLTKCRLIPIESQMIEKLVKKYPYYSESVIPANSYPQIEYDTPCLSWTSLVVTNEEMDDKLAYNIVKEICKEHIDEFKQCHAMAKNLTTEKMIKGMSIPLHNGAAKFWKEQKLIN